MATTVGVVINPTAGGGRARRVGQRATAHLLQRGYRVLDLSAPTAAHALERSRTAAAEGLAALVVVGGDGMVHLGVNAVAETGTPLGIVACGSGNDAARSLGLPVSDAERALTQLLAGPGRAVDAMAVQVAGRVEWALGVVSVGIDAAVNARANTYRWPGGTARYVRALLAELGRFRPYGYRMVVDGVVSELSGTLVAVANTPMIGGGMRIAPGAVVGDGLLEVVVAAGVKRAELLRVFPRVYAGTHLSHPAVSLVRGREVRIEHAPGHPVPPEAFADGERLGPVPLTVTVHPGAVQVLGSQVLSE